MSDRSDDAAHSSSSLAAAVPCSSSTPSFSTAVAATPGHPRNLSTQNATGSDDDEEATITIVPDDQLRQILSYLTLPDLLSLSSSSTRMREASSGTHYLVTALPPREPRRRPAPTGEGASAVGAGAVRRGSGDGGAVADPASVPADATLLLRPPPHAGGTSVASDAPRGAAFAGSAAAAPRFCRAGWGTPRHAAAASGADGPPVTERRLRSLMSRFRSLRTLSLRNLEGMGDRLLPIVNVAPCAASLSELKLDGVRMTPLRAATLDLIGNDNRLRKIRVTGPLFVSYDGVLRSFVTSKNLASVTLGGCRRLSDLDAEDIADRLGGTLEELHFPDCTRLSDPAFRCPKLAKLDLRGCTSLRSLPRIDCPKLRYLNLSFTMGFLNDEAVEAAVRACPVLETLLLEKCPGLQRPRIVSTSIAKLDMRLCLNVESTDVVCDDLITFHIGMCLSLHSLSVESKRIGALDLSMLSLSRLALSTPSLSTLNLSGCYALSDGGVAARCPNLIEVDMCGSGVTASSFEGVAQQVLVREGGQRPPLNWHHRGQGGNA